MIQRRRLFKEIDEEIRRYFDHHSQFDAQIEQALERADPLTRELVFFRASDGDYRQAMQRFHISESTYYKRIRDFKLSLVNLIQK